MARDSRARHKLEYIIYDCHAGRFPPLCKDSQCKGQKAYSCLQLGWTVAHLQSSSDMAGSWEQTHEGGRNLLLIQLAHLTTRNGLQCPAAVKTIVH